MVELNTFDLSVINENLDINFRHIIIKKEFVKDEFGTKIYKYELTKDLVIYLIEYQNLPMLKLSDEGITLNRLTNDGKGPVNMKDLNGILSHLQKNSNIIPVEQNIESNIFLKHDFEINFNNFLLAIQILNPLLLI